MKDVIAKIKSLVANRTLINGMAFSLFSFVNKGFIFLLLLILAAYISPAEYGYLSLFNTVLMVLGYFMALSTEGYMGVSYFEDKANGIPKTFSCILATALIVGLLLLLLLLIAGDGLSEALSLPLDVLYFALVIAFFTVFQNLNLDYFRLHENVKMYGIFSCSNALLNFVLSIVLVAAVFNGWKGRVYAQATCFVLFGIIAFVFFFNKRAFAPIDRKHWKAMLLWGIPLIPHSATNFIRQGLDRYIINGTHTIDDVGLFSFALNIANVIVMVGVGFNQSNSVDTYKVLGDKSMPAADKLSHLRRQRREIGTIYAVIAGAVMVGGYFLIPLLMPQYAACNNYFAILSIYGFLMCLYFLYTNYLFFFKRTKTIMFITIASALLHLGLSLLLTRYSLYFTSLIYIFSQGIVVLLIRHYAMKELRHNVSSVC